GVGLLKFDFLGIKNLAVLADAVKRVKATRDIDIDIENVPVDDAKTYQMLARGETYGCFQLGGSGLTRWLKELRPTTIHDINAMVALYRPGPMEVIPQYIERKRNPKLIQYPDPRIEPFLKESYGLLVYQDDLLYSAIHLAGYSWLEVDLFRKAIGKKIPAEMAKQKQKFTEGVVAHGRDAEFANKMWELFEPFAAYGFNKCLTADTRITNGATGVPEYIGALMERDQSLSIYALGPTGRITPAQGSALRKNGVKDVFRLTTRSGRTIRATANHPLLAFSGWKRLDALQPGNRIAVPRILPEPAAARPLAPYRAATLGYLIAEGNFCHPHGVYYYAKAEDEVADFIAVATQFANARITINRSKSAVSVYVGQERPRDGNALRAWLDTLGMLGKGALEKSIPDCVFAADNATLAIVLGKMWQGDGCVSRQNAQTFYATGSRTLADDVQMLLMRLGIVSTLHEKSFAYRGDHMRGYTVVVTGRANLERFAQTAGMHLLEKKCVELALTLEDATRRTNALGRGTSDTVPAAVYPLIREAVRASGLSTKECVAASGLSERFFGYDARKRGYTREALATLARALHSDTLLAHANSDIFWDEVVSITPDGREMTYDLSVPTYENFVANGLIVHNSHAASYGKVAYQTAYMKANYPVEYMAALLTADSGDTEAIALLVAEASRMGIPVLPPDVNESGTDFTVVKKVGSGISDIGCPTSDVGHPMSYMGAVRFGLSSIKNFGDGIAHAILEEREARGPYASLTDFLSRVGSKNLNRKSLESLIKGGALDSLGERGQLLANIETLLAFHRDATTSAPQDSLFASLASPTLGLLPAEPVSLTEMLKWEKELLGMYVSGHPLDAHAGLLARAPLNLGKIKAEPQPGMSVVLPVLVAEVRTFLTKSGEKMAFLKFEDKTDSLEAVIFPKLYKEHGSLVTAGSCLVIKANVSRRGGELSLAVESLKAL
ncbi:MAG TPA: LAGLIDADG family homing endonuclease, partial [Candidatus Paceibacterota bacterium]